MSQRGFLNQKLGKRMSRRYALLKSQLSGRQPSLPQRLLEQRPGKKGASRESKPQPQ